MHSGFDTVISNWNAVPILLSQCHYPVLDKYLQNIDTNFIYIKQRKMLRAYEISQMT